MSALYLMALIGVGVAILSAAWEAVSSVARPSPWESPMRALVLVRTVDRREQSLPFVGSDRRDRVGELQDSQHDRLAA